MIEVSTALTIPEPGRPVKAITIWQPWASLVAVGAKTMETRSWPTKYRGPIAIHAAQRPFNTDIMSVAYAKPPAEKVVRKFPPGIRDYLIGESL